MKPKVKARIEQKKNKDQLTEEHKTSAHRIDKRSTSLKAAEGSVGGTGGTSSGIYTPTPEQMEVINGFTMSPKSQDEVRAFGLWSCNNLLDRDDERFTTECVKGFAAMEAPFSFIGKSFMADHDYQTAKIRGRIFEVGTAEHEGGTFLTNDVFVPNTERYAGYLEDVDFGMQWAVSVGVVIDKATCAIPGCGATVYTSRWFGSWCDEGHEKGFYYVPGKEEDDGWGFFLPVDPATKGAVKATVDLDDPIDGYEISQVFLGAQYFAELAKKPGFSGMLKTASAAKSTFVGLSNKEADELPIPHEPDEVQEARQQYTVTSDDNGDPTWVDADGMVWVYTTNNETDEPEVMCLGEKGEDDGEGQGGLPREVLQADEDEDEGGDDESDEEVGAVDRPLDSDPEAGSADRPEGERLTDEEAKTVSKKAIKKVLGSLGTKLPDSVVEGLEAADDTSGLTVLLTAVGEHIEAQGKQVTDLTAKAAVGDAYIGQVKKEALRLYVLARKDPNTDGPVSVATFTKLLDRCEGDIELLESMRDEQLELARAKFPDATRRSTFERDHNTPDEPAETPQLAAESGETPKFASRIHRS